MYDKSNQLIQNDLKLMTYEIYKPVRSQHNLKLLFPYIHEYTNGTAKMTNVHKMEIEYTHLNISLLLSSLWLTSV